MEILELLLDEDQDEVGRELLRRLCGDPHSARGDFIRGELAQRIIFAADHACESKITYL